MVQVTAGQRRSGRSVFLSGGLAKSKQGLSCSPIAILIYALAGIYLLVVLRSSKTVLLTTKPPTKLDNGGDKSVIKSSRSDLPPARPNTAEHSNNHLSRRDEFISSKADNKEQARSDKTVAFAVSVTGCGADPITEGAAVLKHSIHLASVHGTAGGTYDYKMFAIYHPSAESCTLPLADLGYTLLKRDVFVKVVDIKGDYLRQKISDNGCCGDKELIKLEAYTLTDFPVVVHLDLDVLVLKPMDEIFDWMINPPEEKPSSEVIMWPDLPWPSTVNAFFTMDYNMVNPHSKYKPVQGGFLVLRPSMDVYEKFRSIVKEGDFRQSGGWGGKVGPFYGSMTFQGLIPYYYNYLHPGQSVELSRCIYNQMCDNPRTGRTINDIVQGDCRIGTEECEDCRSRPIEDVVTTHFTLCQKPWLCLDHSEDKIQARLCRKLTAAWYRIRSDLEASWGRSATGPGKFHNEVFYGFCRTSGKPGYVPIEQPYSKLGR
ncbi:hypothetical protein ACA910_012474 [Epithemia clementina (nom. ined.)]